MKFIETKFEGAFIIEPRKIGDERGYFSRMWCEKTFAAQGLNSKIAQINTSFNAEKGTLRGLHYQRAPHSEVKILQCTRGEVFEVIVDLREGSTTYGHWLGVKLDAQKRNMLYVPEGFANGYQALRDNSAILYSVSQPYYPEAEGGLRWNDPAIGIEWPLAPVNISPKDQLWPNIES